MWWNNKQKQENNTVDIIKLCDNVYTVCYKGGSMNNIVVTLEQAMSIQEEFVKTGSRHLQSKTISSLTIGDMASESVCPNLPRDLLLEREIYLQQECPVGESSYSQHCKYKDTPVRGKKEWLWKKDTLTGYKNIRVPTCMDEFKYLTEPTVQLVNFFRFLEGLPPYSREEGKLVRLNNNYLSNTMYKFLEDGKDGKLVLKKEYHYVYDYMDEIEEVGEFAVLQKSRFNR